MKVDYIIVGQGLAGTILGLKLIENGFTVAIIDNTHFGSASLVAAGVMNPITGRRLVKAWMYDELFLTAKTFYQAQEKKFSVSLFNEYPIYWLLQNAKEENDWLSKYSEVINNFNPEIFNALSFGVVNHAAQVNVALLLEITKKHFQSTQIYLQEFVKYENIKYSHTTVTFKNITAKKLIFCGGAKDASNPFFTNLPFLLSKGEALIINKLSFVADNFLIKKSATLVPLLDNQFWLGATNSWQVDCDSPTLSAKEELLKEWKNMTTATFDIVAQKAAIRPTTQSRKPIIATSHLTPNILLFNGFGTKGTSLIPYFAEEFCKKVVK